MKAMEARLWRGGRTTTPFTFPTSGRRRVADQSQNLLANERASMLAADGDRAPVLAGNAADGDRAPEDAARLHYGKIQFARR
ncbi:MAG: hypothetical protein GF419_12530 [Ignavibacteriales bacterium]|nr:hypothetical protein [Ignavibacteriales bacterium]